MQRLSVELPGAERDRLRLAAYRQGHNVSEIVRALVIAFVRDPEGGMKWLRGLGVDPKAPYEETAD